MDIYPPEKYKNKQKHRMEVLEELEHEHLESHSRGPGFESLCAHQIYKFINETDLLWSINQRRSVFIWIAIGNFSLIFLGQ
jgi:hypothetical protein